MKEGTDEEARIRPAVLAGFEGASADQASPEATEKPAADSSAAVDEAGNSLASSLAACYGSRFWQSTRLRSNTARNKNSASAHPGNQPGIVIARWQKADALGPHPQAPHTVKLYSPSGTSFIQPRGGLPKTERKPRVV